jgi:hypothetical protein
MGSGSREYSTLSEPWNAASHKIPFFANQLRSIFPVVHMRQIQCPIHQPFQAALYSFMAIAMVTQELGETGPWI